MNFAFASILIILLIAPGLIMFTGFFSSPFSKNLLPKNPVNELISAIIPSILLQIAFLEIIQYCSNFQVNFLLLGRLLIPSNNAEKMDEAFTNISYHLPYIIEYHIFLWIFSFSVGYVSRFLIRSFKLDTRYRFFRFNNHWHYLLSGEITRFRHIDLKPLRFIDLRIVDILVNTDDGDAIYTGILQDYTLGNNGDLETLYLSYVKRRPYLKEKKTANHDELDKASQILFSESDKKIPGNLFVVPYNKIININFWYVQLRHSK